MPLARTPARALVIFLQPCIPALDSNLLYTYIYVKRVLLSTGLAPPHVERQSSNLLQRPGAFSRLKSQQRTRLPAVCMQRRACPASVALLASCPTPAQSQPMGTAVPR